MKKLTGATCAAACECGSDFCNDGVCCNQDCSGPCRVCNASGTCTFRSAGTDPEDGCGNYDCNGSGACYPSCTAGAPCASQCKPKAWCSPAGLCVNDRPAGDPCINNCQCVSNNCGVIPICVPP
jgi:hypothetical protein